MSQIERRALMKGAALSALAFSVGGAQVLLSPRQARAQNIPYRTLSPEQVEILEALGETLVPGAAAAGISHFVDQQLSIPPEEALLEARILNIRPPYAISTARRSARSTAPATRTTTTGLLQISARMSGAISSIRCA